MSGVDKWKEAAGWPPLWRAFCWLAGCRQTPVEELEECQSPGWDGKERPPYSDCRQEHQGESAGKNQSCGHAGGDDGAFPRAGPAIEAVGLVEPSHELTGIFSRFVVCLAPAVCCLAVGEFHRTLFGLGKFILAAAPDVAGFAEFGEQIPDLPKSERFLLLFSSGHLYLLSRLSRFARTGRLIENNTS